MLKVFLLVVENVSSMGVHNKVEKQLLRQRSKDNCYSMQMLT